MFGSRIRRLASSKAWQDGSLIHTFRLLVCCCIFAGACTSKDTAPTAEDAANLLAEDMDSAQLIPSDVERQASTDDGDITPDLAFIDAVAECMRAEGFDYVAALPENESAGLELGGDAGYGIVASVIASEPDPNEAILQELSLPEQESYLVALWGDPVAETHGCAGAAMDVLVDGSEDGNESEPELFVNRDIEELRARTVALATSRPEVVNAVNEAVACANDRLGTDQIDDSFDFLSIAEYRVARIIDKEQAEEGATLFDLVASAEDGQIVLDRATIEAMVHAEEEIRHIEIDCRSLVQPILRQAFVEVAADLLADDPETTAAIINGGS